MTVNDQRSNNHIAASTGPASMLLNNGSRVGVIGGGPAGSFFSYFLLTLANRIGTKLHVEIFEPRDFKTPGPKGCNMCAGIISESLVQMLAMEGILLPSNIVQRGISNYTLHTLGGSVSFDAPSYERRIATVFRGGGPLNEDLNINGFDGFMLDLACKQGAIHTKKRVDEVFLDESFPGVRIGEEKLGDFDLLIIATGINAKPLFLSQKKIIDYQSPKKSKCHVREYRLGKDKTKNTLGDSVQIFLSDIPEIEFAALIPKGDHITLCMMGSGIDQATIKKFFDQKIVKQVFDINDVDEAVCCCSPSMHLSAAQNAYSDRIAFIGDAGASRIFKDGIGAAYRTAKGCATSALLHGVSKEAFAKYYWPICREIENDNRIGKFVIKINHEISKRRFSTRGMIRMIEQEQMSQNTQKYMTSVMWDVFTGSANYNDIFKRTLHPLFISRFIKNLIPKLSDYN